MEAAYSIVAMHTLFALVLDKRVRPSGDLGQCWMSAGVSVNCPATNCPLLWRVSIQNQAAKELVFSLVLG